MKRCPTCKTKIAAVGFYVYRQQYFIGIRDGYIEGAAGPAEGVAYCVLCDARLPWKSWELVDIRKAAA